MKLSVNTCIAAACLTLLVASVQAGADRKKTCLVLNKASSFIDLTNPDKTCPDDCTGDWATCKCESFGKPTKPYPSLAQCYKYNQESCCKAGHDAAIQSAYKNLLSDTCIRNYPDLETLYCLACNNEQPKYVDVANKTVYICKDFAKKLWTGANYDNCGINIGGTPKIPQFEFASVSEFLNHASIKPPFFGDYTIDVDATENCLASWGVRQATISTLALLVVVLFQGILM